MTEEQKRNYLVSQGYNPDEYDVVFDAPEASVEQPITPEAQPISMGEAVGTTLKHAALPSAAALGAMAMVPATWPVLGTMAAAAGVGMGASYLQDRLLKAFQSPENYAARRQSLEQARTQWPKATLGAEMVPTIATMRALPLGALKNAIPMLAQQSQRAAYANTLKAAGLGAGVNTGLEGASQALSGDFDPQRLALAGVGGAYFGGGGFRSPFNKLPFPANSLGAKLSEGNSLAGTQTQTRASEAVETTKPNLPEDIKPTELTPELQLQQQQLKEQLMAKLSAGLSADPQQNVSSLIHAKNYFANLGGRQVNATGNLVDQPSLNPLESILSKQEAGRQNFRRLLAEARARKATQKVPDLTAEAEPRFKELQAELEAQRAAELAALEQEGKIGELESPTEIGFEQQPTVESVRASQRPAEFEAARAELVAKQQAEAELQAKQAEEASRIKNQILSNKSLQQFMQEGQISPGMTAEELAKKFGVSYQEAQAALKKSPAQQVTSELPPELEARYKELAKQRGIVLVQSPDTILTPTGEVAAGAAIPRLRTAIAGPDEGLDTKPHEFGHIFLKDLMEDPDVVSQALVNKGKQIAGSEENLVQLMGRRGYELAERMSGKFPDLKNWLKDFWSHIKIKFGNANDKDFANVITRRMYDDFPYTAKGARPTPSINPNKPLSKEEAKYQPASEAQKFKRNKSGVATSLAQLDKAAKSSEAGQYLAPKLELVYDSIDAYKGKYNNKATQLLKPYTVEQRQAIDRHMQDMRLYGKSTVELTPEQKATIDALRKLNVAVHEEQRSLRIPVSMDGVPRQAKDAPYYYANSMKPDVMRRLRQEPSSEEATKLKDDFFTFRRSLGQNEKDINTDFDTILEALQGEKGIDIASQYGAIDKPMGKGLPDSWRETDPLVNLDRYFSRVGRRFSWFKHVQTDPIARTLTGDNVDPYTLEVDTQKYFLPTGSQAMSAKGDEYLAPIIRSLKGDNPAQDTFGEAASGLVKSIMMGPLTGVRDATTTPIAALELMKLSDVPEVTGKVLTNFKQYWADSFDSGLNTYRIGSLESVAENINDLNAVLIQGRDFANKWQGRQLAEQVARAINQGQGDAQIRIAISKLAKGDKSKQYALLMDRVTRDDWRTKIAKKGQGAYTNDEIKQMARRFGQQFQSTYDYRDNPTGTFEGHFAPFLALARWSVGRSSRFVKNVVQEIPKGNYEPLINSTIGLFLGGAIGKGLLEAVYGKKDRTASWKEIEVAQQAGKPVSQEIAYKLSALAAASANYGIFADLLYSTMSRMRGDTPNEVLNSPLIEAINTSGDLAVDALKAFDKQDYEGGTEILTKLIGGMGQALSQTYRIAAAQLNEDKAERANKFRDVRVFKRLYGYPQGSAPEGRPSAFSETPAKQFKQAKTIKEAIEIYNKQLLPELKNEKDPSVLEAKIRSLKGNSYQTFPQQPGMKEKYYEFLNKTQGKKAAQERLTDWEKQSEVNKLKSSLLP